jgi:selenocysteine lyase/cysteine desulfurase
MIEMSLARSCLAPSVETIRSDFPGLRRLHGGQQVAYFYGPGGTQVPEAVGDAVIDYLYNHNANTRWEYQQPGNGLDDFASQGGNGRLAGR